MLGSAAARHPEPAQAAQPGSNKPPFDLSRLRRFTLGNVGLEQELLGLFATQAPIMLAALHRADTQTAWRDAGHTLRGSSASIGAWLVAEAAERAERLVGNPDAWDNARSEVAAAIDVSLAYVAEVSANNAAGQASN
jgi:HPt (histidine-containing phosphotransfer) domain-containing protein